MSKKPLREHLCINCEEPADFFWLGIPWCYKCKDKMRKKD